MAQQNQAQNQPLPADDPVPGIDPLHALDSLIRPGEFNGYSNEDASAHLEKFESWIALKGIQDEHRMARAFRLLMRENALAWLKSLEQNVVNNWDALRDAFITKFAAPENKMTKNRDLMERKQGPNESVDEYIKQMQKLANYLEKSETDVVYMIIQGFRPSIKEKLLMTDITNFQQLERLARVAERSLASASSTDDVVLKSLMAAEKSRSDTFTDVTSKLISLLDKKIDVNNVATPSVQPQYVQVQPQATDRTTTGRPRQRPGGPVRIQGNCWFCQKPGHRSRDCRARKADEMRNSVQKPNLNQNGSA